jgi:glyoxylase-like metal-dependent hydrolase (beta-lactamase superfamily II)
MTRDWSTGSSLAVSGRPQRVHPLVVGYEPIPESLSVLGGDPSRFLLEPVTAAAVVFDDGWVLLDSGFNVDVVRDPQQRARHFNFDSYTAVVPPGDPLADGVAAAGLDWADLAACAISHVHVDHTGGLRLLSPDVPVLMQRAEWEYGSVHATTADAVIVEDFTRPGLDIVLLDGDTSLATGLEAIDTSGHTPGHQSFVIGLASSRVVLACDAADLRVNITDRIPCGSTMRPGADDVERARIAIDRLHALDGEADTQVWPGHDPDWWAWKEQVVR